MKLNRHPTINQLIDDKFPIWNFDYEIFDESYRQTLEQLITDTFMFRQISYADPAQWQHRLKVKMSQIMPYYNRRYVSDLAVFDPFLTEHVTTSYKRAEDTSTRTAYLSALKSKDAENAREAARTKQKFDEQFTEHTDDKNLTIMGEVESMTEKELTDQEEGRIQATVEDLAQTVDGTTKQTTLATTNDTSDKQTDTDKTHGESTRTTENSQTDMHGDKSVDSESDTDTTSKVLGHSDKDITDHKQTQANASKVREDFPQASMSSNPAGNFGEWATWRESDTANTTSDGKATEKIDSTQNTTGTENTNKTEDTDYSEHTTGNVTGSKTTDIDETEDTSEHSSAVKKFDETINGTNHEDTDRTTNTDETEDKELQREVDTTRKTTNDADRDYKGTIDRDNQTHSTTDGEKYENKMTDRERASDLHTHEDKKQGNLSEGAESVAGFRGISPAQLLAQWRDTFLNVNLEIIRELEILFMGVF